jgi:hypothetical protein
LKVTCSSYALRSNNQFQIRRFETTIPVKDPL